MQAAKRIAYWSQPNARISQNQDGSQNIGYIGYWYYKLVCLYFASITSITESEITAAIETEFYPGPGMHHILDPGLSVMDLDQISPSLPYANIRLLGRYLNDSDVVYTGTDKSNSYPLPPITKPVQAQFSLLNATSSSQKIGYVNQQMYKVEWAQAHSHAESDITNQIQLNFYHPVTNPDSIYVLQESSVYSSVRFVDRIPPGYRQRWNCDLVGVGYSKTKS